MRGCRRAHAAIFAAQDRALALEERLVLEQHLASCAECLELHERSQAIDEALEKLSAADLPDLSGPAVERAVAGVRRALASAAGEPLERGTRRRGSRRAAALAITFAAALIGVLVGRAFLADGGVSRGPGPVSRTQGPPATPAAVEASVREELRSTFGALEPAADAQAALLRFEEATLELRRTGWPVVRYVEDLLDDPELVVATAAARALGALRDPLSAAPLERALEREGLADEALRAQGALGTAGIPPLERALDRPALAVAALRELCSIGGPVAAAAIESRIQERGAETGGVPSRQALLDALSMSGPAAVASLLRLASAPGAPSDVIERLAFVDRAKEELARLLERPDPAWSSTAIHGALVILQPERGLAWLEERCGETRERGAALHTLERWNGAGPIASILRLDASGRVPREELLVLLRGLLERDERRFAPFTRTLLAEGDPRDAQRLTSLLIESEHGGAGASLAHLALDASLPDDDRQWAALALGEFGRPADAELLASGLSRLGDEERRLYAACLISIHDRLGDAGVEAALAGFTTRDLSRVLAALGELEDHGAVGLHRVARALDGALTRRDPEAWNQTL